MPGQSRRSEIDRRRSRHQKLAKLRKRYAAARTDTERSKILDKVRRITRSLTPEQYVRSAS